MNKDIRGFEGLYTIDEDGNVYSIRSKKYLRPSVGTNGYLSITLCVNNVKTKREIHRLVAETFIPNNDNLPEVNHRDENKCNNNVNNLEWCSRMYNAHYGTAINRMSKSLTGKPATWFHKPIYQLDMNNEIIKEWACSSDAAKYLGVDGSLIRRVCRGEGKSAYGYRWRYADE